MSVLIVIMLVRIFMDSHSFDAVVIIIAHGSVTVTIIVIIMFLLLTAFHDGVIVVLDMGKGALVTATG